MIDSIEQVPIDQIIPYENNARINDHVVPYLANAIEEVGFIDPIVLDEDNIIIAGHTRLKALLMLRDKRGYLVHSVPCVRAKDLTEEQIRLARIADNRLNQLAQDDFEKLKEELSHITYDVKLVGFEDTLKQMAQQANTEPEPVPVNMNSFSIIIKCEDEADAEEKFQKLTSEGYKCSLSTL